MRETRKNKHINRYSEGRNPHCGQGMQFAKRSARCDEGRGHIVQPNRDYCNHSHRPKGLGLYHQHHSHRAKEYVENQRFYGPAMRFHPEHAHRDASRLAYSLQREIRTLEGTVFHMMRRLKAMERQVRASAGR